MKYIEGNITVMATDMDESIKFYTEVLGLAKGRAFGKEWVEVEAPNVRIGLHPAKGKKPFVSKDSSPLSSIGLRVEDLDAAVEEIKTKNVKVGPLVEDRGSRVCFFQDPDGTSIYFIEMKFG